MHGNENHDRVAWPKATAPSFRGAEATIAVT